MQSLWDHGIRRKFLRACIPCRMFHFQSSLAAPWKVGRKPEEEHLSHLVANVFKDLQSWKPQPDSKLATAHHPLSEYPHKKAHLISLGACVRRPGHHRTPPEASPRPATGAAILAVSTPPASLPRANCSAGGVARAGAKGGSGRGRPCAGSRGGWTVRGCRWGFCVTAACGAVAMGTRGSVTAGGGQRQNPGALGGGRALGEPRAGGGCLQFPIPFRPVLPPVERPCRP